jgi:predicted outer membrane protein
MTKRFVSVALLLLTACGKEQPAGPTAEQSAQLNEAENMLNDAAANEEGPADRSTGPSNNSD